MIRENGITVEQLLASDIMRGSTLIAGEKGIKNTITKANIYADNEILDWVTPKEILLATEENFRGWDDDQYIDFFKRSDEIGISALAVKYSSANHKLNHTVLQVANDIGLPIIHIHKKTPIVEVNTAVFQLVFAKQADLLAHLEQFHEELLHCLLKGGFVEDVLVIIQSHINNPVVFDFANYDNNIVIFNENNDKMKALLLNDVHRNRTSHGFSFSFREDIIELEGRRVTRMVVPVTNNEKIYGNLYTWGVDTSLGGFDLSLMESASTNIALMLLQEASIREVEIKHSSEFVDELLSIPPRESALDRARVFNLNVEDPYCLVLLRVSDCENSKNIAYCSEGVYDFIYSNIKWIESHMKKHHIDGMVTTKKSYLQLILKETEDRFDERLMEFLTTLIRLLESKASPLDLLDMQVGVGRVYPDLTQLYRSRLEAVKAIEVGSKLFEDTIVRYDDLGIFKIIIHDSLNEDVREFYNETLKPLVDYDKKKSTELVQTLEAYFRNNGNVTKTSEEMYTHYNTILYRLERIKDITRLDLNNANDRLNLEMALKITMLYRF